MKAKDKPKVIILAAGVGTRLAPLTDRVPKCLVPVAGKPILEHQIEAFRRWGLDEIFVVAGYRCDQVKSALNGCGRVVVNSEYRSTNNMYSMSLAAPYVDGSCFLVNGDVVFDSSIVDGMLETSFPDLIAVDKGRYIAESMKVTVAGGRITGISKQISPDQTHGCSIDLYRFSASTMKSLFEVIAGYLTRGERNRWTEVAINDLLHKCELRPFDIGGKPWSEIDNHDDLREAETIWSPKAS